MSHPNGPYDGLEVGEASPLVATALRWLTWGVVGVTFTGLALPGTVGTVFAWTAVSLLIAAPIVRVLWLGVRWFNRGDKRFAGAAVVLVLVVAAGGVVAWSLSR